MISAVKNPFFIFLPLDGRVCSTRLPLCGVAWWLLVVLLYRVSARACPSPHVNAPNSKTAALAASVATLLKADNARCLQVRVPGIPLRRHQPPQMRRTEVRRLAHLRSRSLGMSHCGSELRTGSRDMDRLRKETPIHCGMRKKSGQIRAFQRATERRTAMTLVHVCVEQSGNAKSEELQKLGIVKDFMGSRIRVCG